MRMQVDLDTRIAAAETALNSALDRAQELASARQQVLDALEDLRLYRNVLALQPFALRRPDIPAQRRPMKSIAGQFAQHLREEARRTR